MSPIRGTHQRAGQSRRWTEAEDYQRRNGKRQPRGRLFIVCEGKETEPLYFESAWREKQRQNLFDPVIIVKPGKSKTFPTAVVQRAIDIKERDENWDRQLDQIWAVFDIEQEGTHADLPGAIALAGENRVNLAISNPSVEYWFLLHFENTNRSFQNADQVCAALRKYIPDYIKNKPVFVLIRDRMETALSRTQSFRKQADRHWDDFPNPSTGLDLLIREIFFKG
jgi:hypothetical protein